MIIPRNVFCGATWPRRTGMIDGWLCAFESVGWASRAQREETRFFVGGHSGDVFSFFPPLDCRFPWFIPVFVFTYSRGLKRKTRKRGAMWWGCWTEQRLNRTETHRCDKRPQTDSSDVCLSLCPRGVLAHCARRCARRRAMKRYLCCAREAREEGTVHTDRSPQTTSNNTTRGVFFYHL